MNNDLAEMISSIAASNVRMVQIGTEVAEKRFYAVIRGLDAAYRLALMDPETKIPSPLGACIAALISLLPESPDNISNIKPDLSVVAKPRKGAA